MMCALLINKGPLAMYQHFWQIEKDQLELLYKIALRSLRYKARDLPQNSILWEIINDIEKLKKADESCENIKLYTAALTETVQLLNKEISPDLYILNSHKMLSQSVETARKMWVLGLSVASIGACCALCPLTAPAAIPLMIIGSVIFIIGLVRQIYFSSSKQCQEQFKLEKSLEKTMIELANTQPLPSDQSVAGVSAEDSIPAINI